MKIIFEGPDGCGKTNIAEALSKRIGVPVYKSGKEADIFYDKNAQYLTLKWANYEMIKILETTNASIIFDRFFPSEYVYSKVFDRNSDPELVLEYDEWWHKIGGKIIFLDKQTIDVDDELVPRSKYNEIRERYIKYMGLTKCKFLYLDTSDYNLEEQVNTICDFLFL